jgi:hypothetical protein
MEIHTGAKRLGLGWEAPPTIGEEGETEKRGLTWAGASPRKEGRLWLNAHLGAWDDSKRGGGKKKTRNRPEHALLSVLCKLNFIKINSTGKFLIEINSIASSIPSILPRGSVGLFSSGSLFGSLALELVYWLPSTSKQSSCTTINQYAVFMLYGFLQGWYFSFCFSLN